VLDPHLLQGVSRGTDLLFNFSIDRDSIWKFVETEFLPPACLPEELHGHGSAFRVLVDDEWILRGSIGAGLSLTIHYLRQVSKQIGVKLPKQGSGKNGAIKKIDRARALVKHLWPDCDNDHLTKVVNSLCGFKKKSQQVDLSVLAFAAEMDTDNQESFKNLKKQAEQKLESIVFGKGHAAASSANSSKKTPEELAEAVKSDKKKLQKALDKEASSKRKEYQRAWDLTPASLKKLLPGGGTVSGVFWGRYHPAKKFWRCDFPVGVWARNRIVL